MASNQQPDSESGYTENDPLFEAAQRDAMEWKDTWNPSPFEGPPGYEIIREIHRGGQGVVFEAIQLSTLSKIKIDAQSISFDFHSDTVWPNSVSISRITCRTNRWYAPKNEIILRRWSFAHER